MEKDPIKFENAYFHPKKEKREGWRMAIKKELESMERCKVWTMIHKREMPKERKVIGNRWVFVQKRNGVYRARLVALGYSQTAGIDFLNHYSPVLCDTSFRLLLLIIQKLKLDAWSSDVETAFLNGDLSEEIFMKIPQGYNLVNKMENTEDKVLKLNKSIYGLVQAARQWHEKFSEEILNMGFKSNHIDPCIFFKEENGEFCILCIYVDDGIITGSIKLMEETVEKLNKVFKIKFEKNIHDFIGCQITQKNGKILLGQQRIIEKLSSVIDKRENNKQWSTPSAPSFLVIRSKKKEKMINEKKQKWFRSAIGTLLYLVKLSRPDLANSVRELAKVIDGANQAQEKELKRTIEYTIQKKERSLKIEAKTNTWDIIAYSDSDFAGDKDDRKSITGYIIFVSGTAISWKSKSQPCVTLSSTEAEYVALNETVREVKFIFQILETMGIEAKRPAKIYVDNVGSIFLSKNKTSGERTKHIDLKYHFVREQIQNGLIDVQFIRTSETPNP
jgi:hypothetical protein